MAPGGSLRHRGSENGHVEVGPDHEPEQKVHAAPQAAGGRGMGSMLGLGASMLQKVATHVVGSEEASAANKMKPQLDVLKSQLLVLTQENEGLVQANEELTLQLQRMERELQEKQAELDMAGAGATNATLLKEEFLKEQGARKEAEAKLLKVRACFLPNPYTTGCMCVCKK